MKNLLSLFAISLFIFSPVLSAQTQEEIVAAIEKEGIENSQLEQLAYELMDLNGPRFVGTPEMKTAHDWAVNTYKKWGISAENQQWGNLERLATRHYACRYGVAKSSFTSRYTISMESRYR